MIKSIDEFIFDSYNFFALKSIIVLSIYEKNNRQISIVTIFYTTTAQGQQQLPHKWSIE
jgi:hypothetical protein